MLLIAGGFASAVIDGTRSIAAGTLLLISFGDLFASALPKQFLALQAAAERMHPKLWNPVLLDLLLIPASLLLALVGVLLLWLVRSRTIAVGYLTR